MSKFKTGTRNKRESEKEGQRGSETLEKTKVRLNYGIFSAAL